MLIQRLAVGLCSWGNPGLEGLGKDMNLPVMDAGQGNMEIWTNFDSVLPGIGFFRRSG
jgi:hypothetical protein